MFRCQVYLPEGMDSMGKWERGAVSIGTKPTKLSAISCQRSGSSRSLFFFFLMGQDVLSTARLMGIPCPDSCDFCQNLRFPDAIRKLTPITQLYISQSLGSKVQHSGQAPEQVTLDSMGEGFCTTIQRFESLRRSHLCSVDHIYIPSGNQTWRAGKSTIYG